MTEEQREIIKDFIDNAPSWFKSLKDWGYGRCCPMCGSKYDKFYKLREVLEIWQQENKTK